MKENINNDLFLFNFKGANFVYTNTTNNIYKISSEALNYLHEGENNIEVKKEFEKLTFKKKDQRIYNYHSTHLNINGNNIKDAMEESLSSLDKKISYSKKELFLELENSELHINEILTFNSILQELNFQLIIIENIDKRYSESNSKIIENSKIFFKYYADFNTAKSLFNKYKDIRGVLEIRVKSKKQIDELIREIKFSTNLAIEFKCEGDDEVAKYLFDNLNLVSSNILSNKKRQRFFNITKLLKINIGDLLPNNDFTYVQGPRSFNKENCIKCSQCWAKQHCWNSRAFKIFTNHPELTSQNPLNCDLIKNLIKTVFIVYLEAKDKTLPKKPILFGSKKFKLKFLNP